MITKQDAVRIAEEHVNNGSAYPDNEERFVDDEWTIERDYGWIFMCNTAEFIRTRSRRHAIVGNAPLLVLREDGAVIRFPSSYTREKALAAFEADPERFPPVAPRS